MQQTLQDTVKTQILVIGNGMVGHHFIEQLRQRDAGCRVTVLCGEPQLAYDRVYLSSYFTGTPFSELSMSTEQWYQEQQVDLQLNCWVERIVPTERLVYCRDGRVYSYEKLVLATGSYPFVPPIPGNDQPHCLVYRTLQDLQNIEASAAQSKVGVVIGGGLLGLEAANALKQLGLETHVVEFAPQLMAVQLDQAGGALLAQKIQQLGVTVHTGKGTQAIVPGTQCRYQLQFADGSTLETDLVLFSAGIRPYDQLGRSSGLAVGERGGIVINDLCQTSDPSTYAIGECALWQQKIFGLVAPGYQMARVVADQLVNQQQATLTFSGADMSTKLKLLGVEVGSIGDAHAKTPGAMSYLFTDPKAGHYKKLVVSQNGKKLLGAVLVGDTSPYDTLLQYALNDMPLPANPEQLILPASGQTALPALVLPDSATICSCHNVAKGDIVGAIGAGVCDLASIKQCTKAATGCGGCSALLKSVVDEELKARGVEVSNHLCEHFAYSRQELLHLIQVEGLTTFYQILSQHGKGHGCEICKPTIGSLLASVHNEYVLKKPHVGLQDTNDTFLANMQKDGSYSIVHALPVAKLLRIN